MSENDGSVDKIKRKRCKNYSDKEKENLIQILSKYKHIIENKQTDSVWATEKRKAWDEIATTYNETATTGSRAASQLKLLYDGMKKVAKKHKANDKVEIHKTGGGSLPPTQITDTDKKIIQMLGSQLEPHANPYDSNADFDFNNSTIIIDSDKSNELSAYEQDLAAVRGMSDQPNIICDIPLNIETSDETEIDRTAASTSKVHNKSWKTRFTKNKTKSKNSIAHETYANAIFKMKQAKHDKQMAVLDIIQKKEQAELELKLLELERMKRASQ